MSQDNGNEEVVVLTQPTTQRKTIRALSPDTIRTLGAEVNVLSISHCIKELVENALDSGATSIDVRLESSGYSSIQVTDNGHGVPEEDLEDMFRKNYTSKVEEDGMARKYGFRGIFLFSLCGICSDGDIEVITKTQQDTMGTKISISREGTIMRRDPHQCNVGTIIIVKNIFSGFPVRRQHMKQSLAKQLSETDTILHEYSLICMNAKFTLRNNEKSSGNETTVFTKAGTKSTSSSICTVFGTRLYNNIKMMNFEDENLKLELHVPASSEKATEVRQKDVKGNRLFIYLNNRPVNYDKLQKLVKDIYARHLGNKGLFGYFGIEIDPSCVDLNLDPDKRKIILSSTAEKMVLEKIEKILLGLYDKSEKPKLHLPPKQAKGKSQSGASDSTSSAPLSSPNKSSTPERVKRTQPLSAIPDDLSPANNSPPKNPLPPRVSVVPPTPVINVSPKKKTPEIPPNVEPVKFTTHYVARSKNTDKMDEDEDDFKHPAPKRKDAETIAADKRFFNNSMYQPREKPSPTKPTSFAVGKEQAQLESYFGTDSQKERSKKRNSTEVDDLSDEQAKKKQKTSHEGVIDNLSTLALIEQFAHIKTLSKPNASQTVVLDQTKGLIQRSQVLNKKLECIGVISQQKCDYCCMLVKLGNKVQILRVYECEFKQVYLDLQKTMTFEGGIRPLQTPIVLRRVAKFVDNPDLLRAGLKKEYIDILRWNGFHVRYQESQSSSQGDAPKKRLLTGIELSGALSTDYLGGERSYGIDDLVELCQKILTFDSQYLPKFYKTYLEVHNLEDGDLEADVRKKIKTNIVNRSLRMIRTTAINDHFKRRAKEVLDKRHGSHQAGCAYTLSDCEKVLRDHANASKSVRDEIVMDEVSEPQDCDLKGPFQCLLTIEEKVFTSSQGSQTL